MSFARTLGELRQSPFTEQRLASRHVKDELRENLMARLREGSPIFPGIVGYDDTVVPQIVNAILSATTSSCSGSADKQKAASCAP